MILEELCFVNFYEFSYSDVEILEKVGIPSPASLMGKLRSNLSSLERQCPSVMARMNEASINLSNGLIISVIFGNTLM